MQDVLLGLRQSVTNQNIDHGSHRGIPVAQLKAFGNRLSHRASFNILLPGLQLTEKQPSYLNAKGPQQP